ncbi:MAG: hypothetical protein LBM98_10790 [Oscillospiraceae bacterium]|nr:hypothetical protein [Oscillospiraceae bacterium]
MHNNNTSIKIALRLCAHGAGNHPAACGRHPSTEGIRTWGWTWGARSYAPAERNLRPNLVPIPSVEGCPRRGGVVVT